jgi:hypothetical protein
LQGFLAVPKSDRPGYRPGNPLVLFRAEIAAMASLRWSG